MAKPKWDDLTEQQQGSIVLAIIVQVALALVAFGALIGRPKEYVRGSKVAWFFGLFVNFVGPLAFLLFGRKSKAKVDAREPYLLEVANQIGE